RADAAELDVAGQSVADEDVPIPVRVAGNEVRGRAREEEAPAVGGERDAGSELAARDALDSVRVDADARGRRLCAQCCARDDAADRDEKDSAQRRACIHGEPPWRRSIYRRIER